MKRISMFPYLCVLFLLQFSITNTLANDVSATAEASGISAQDKALQQVQDELKKRGAPLVRLVAPEVGFSVALFRRFWGDTGGATKNH